MSQSLIVFEASGRVLYKQNNKISPFNELIYSIVDESFTDLGRNFYTVSGSSGQRRYYCLNANGLWAAFYVDVITTLESDKIRQSLSDVLRTYSKLCEEDVEKMGKLIDFQFNNMIKLKQDSDISEKKHSISEKDQAQPVKANDATVVKKKDSLSKSKKMRKWVNGELVDGNQDDSALDYSNGLTDGQELSIGNLQVDDKAAFTRQDDLVLLNELHDVLDDGVEEEEENKVDGSVKASHFISKLSSYFGSSADIQEVSNRFTDQLISKNISPPMAKTIIDRIKSRLAANKVTVAAFKEALTEELTKILTPNVSTDLLYDIKKKASGRPYVISIVGVNGVGKSTNLAKLAYWFLQNNMNVLICACDTFRSGAVEQLKVHVNNLQRLNTSSSTAPRIELFEKGYGGGDHVVNTAKSAIAYAEAQHFDVVLIDTAGRTHSNAKLMAPLKKFGDAANPDKIIMVGEALVGTDSVEQAINFNNAFGNRRGLNFFIISKVDTVGDLVGAMINMTMATRVPILFVGTGQTYTDIKRLSVKRVVEMLTA